MSQAELDFHKNYISSILTHYLDTVFKKAGLVFDRDNQAEIRDIAESIEAMIKAVAI